MVCLWLHQYIELKRARDNSCVARADIKPAISRMLAAYLFHCAIMKQLLHMLKRSLLHTFRWSTHQIHQILYNFEKKFYSPEEKILSRLILHAKHGTLFFKS